MLGEKSHAIRIDSYCKPKILQESFYFWDKIFSKAFVLMEYD